MPEVLDIIQTDFVKVSWGDTSLNVPRNHLYDALIEGCKNNMVSEPHCCVDIGEIIDAQIEGLSSMLQEGLILTEAYPQNLPHMKDGAVLPTTYATDKNGNKKGKTILGIIVPDIYNLVKTGVKVTISPGGLLKH